MGKIAVDEATDLYRYFLPYIILQNPDGSYLFIDSRLCPSLSEMRRAQLLRTSSER
jgi:hypothetical protein